MSAARQNGANGARKSILELAPLECDCMNALWPLGEATVQEIRDVLAPTRPRAYTTIMTIMDRLARKGVVARRKVGRAYRYHANLSAEDARTRAVAQLVDSFFGGSTQGLAAHLSGVPADLPDRPVGAPARAPAVRDRPRPKHKQAGGQEAGGAKPAAPHLDAALL